MNITKTCLYSFDPIKPHFYIVKLGFIGVYIIFLISTQNIDCGYSLEPPRRGGSNEYHNLCFVQKYEKYRSFLSENFQFLEMKCFIYLNRRVFVMSAPKHDVLFPNRASKCHMFPNGMLRNAKQTFNFKP